eukprot:351140-Chlamydomonas_euryale.AAC.43
MVQHARDSNAGLVRSPSRELSDVTAGPERSPSHELTEAAVAFLPQAEVEMVLGVQRSILNRLKGTHAKLREQNEALELAIGALRAARHGRTDLAVIRQHIDNAYTLLR